MYSKVKTAVDICNQLQQDGIFELYPLSPMRDDWALTFDGRRIVSGEVEKVGYYVAGIYAYLKLRKGERIMKKLADVIAKLAMKTAVSAGGTASQWLVYQPAEPAMLKKLRK